MDHYIQMEYACLTYLFSPFEPIASTSSATAFPYVATAPAAPGPTSLPDGLIV
jgi:hypothetical protein